MAKTCRTCSELYPWWRCRVHRIFMQPDEIVKCHESRETPLLVDALAAAVEELMTPRHTSEERAVGHDLGHFALARYKEEVGDARNVSNR